MLYRVLLALVVAGVVRSRCCPNSRLSAICYDGAKASNCNSAVQHFEPGLCSESGACGAPLICGDGRLDPGEECDDDNTVSGDGCSKDCEIEHLGSCCVLQVGEAKTVDFHCLDGLDEAGCLEKTGVYGGEGTRCATDECPILWWDNQDEQPETAELQGRRGRDCGPRWWDIYMVVVGTVLLILLIAYFVWVCTRRNQQIRATVADALKAQ